MKTSLKKMSGWALFSLKRHYLCLSIAFFSFNLSAQIEGGIRLKWKIAHGDTLVYKTVMSEEEVTEGIEKDTNQNMGNLFLDKFLQPADEYNENNERLSKLSLQKNGDMGVMVCTHKTEKGKAATRAEYEAIFKKRAIEDKSEKSDTNTDSLLYETIGLMTKDYVEFEGAIEVDGGIKSFYLDKYYKNSLALLFELPSKSVKIGDTWAIDVQFNTIIMDFTCDSVFKKNQVKLIDIKKQKHDTIAVLEYDIQEFITGRFYASPENNIFQTNYKAIAEFSVSKGRWLSYNGKMFQKITSRFAYSEPEIKRYILMPKGQ